MNFNFEFKKQLRNKKKIRILYNGHSGPVFIPLKALDSEGALKRVPFF